MPDQKFLTNLDVAGTVDLSNLTINSAQGADGQVLTSTGTGIAWEDASGGASLSGGAANKLAIWSAADTLTNDTNLHWDTTNDRLGIGDSTPSYTLDVNGTIYGSGVRSGRYYGTSGTSSYLDLDSGAPYSLIASSEISVTDTITCNDLTATEPGGIAASNGAVYGLRFYGYGNTTYYVDPNDSTTSAMLNGNVGIGSGVNAPNNPLHIRKSSSGNSASSSQLKIEYNSTYNLAISHRGHFYAAGVNDYKFVRGSSNQMVIKGHSSESSYGYVGIGIDSPTQKLHVNGNVTADRYYGNGSTAYYVDPNHTGTALYAAGDIRAASTKGFTSDGLGKLYAWRAVDNTEGNSTNYVKIARLTGTAAGVDWYSDRCIIELAGRSSSYSNNALPAMGYIVAQLQSDANWDVVYYNHHNGSDEVVDEVGVVQINNTQADIYVRVGAYAEVTASGHISDGHIAVDNTRSGSAPSGYSAANAEYKVWNSGNDGSGSGLDADLLDGQEGSYYLNYNNFSNTPTIPTNNNQLTNGAGYTTNTGDITGVTAGSYMTGGGTSGTVTLNANASTGADANTLAARTSSGDIYARLLRATYANQSTISGAIAFRVNNGADNYTRYCNNPSAIRTFIGAGTSSFSGSYNDLSNKPTSFTPSAHNQAWSTITGTPTTLAGYGITDAAEKNFINSAYVDFTVNGNADTYYPVSIRGAGHYGYHSYSISRGYNWTAPNTWNNSTHKGGLTFTWQYSGDGFWGGNDHDIRVIKWDETYSTIVGGMGGSVGGGGTHAGVVVWLRGGGALYRFHGPEGALGDVNVHLSSVTASNGATFAPRTTHTSATTEIFPKYPIRSSSSIHSQYHYGSDSTQTMYLGESGNDVLIRGQVAIGGTAIQSGYALTMTGAIDMNNGGIDYAHQLHFNDNVRFYEDGNDNYLNFKWGDTGPGGIKFRDGNGNIHGYVYGNMDDEFGFLDADGNWAVRIENDAILELRVNNSQRFDCSTGGCHFRNGSSYVGQVTTLGVARFANDVVAYYNFSDKRLKTDIKATTNNLDKILKLEPVEYTWKDGGREGQKEIGLIAQDVEKVVPEVVRENERLNDDTLYKQVDYEHLVSTLIGAVQEQQKQIDELKSIINGGS